jgi:hypothetical protein
METSGNVGKRRLSAASILREFDLHKKRGNSGITVTIASSHGDPARSARRAIFIESFMKHDNALARLRLTSAANWGQSELSARLLQKLHSDPT